MGLFITVSPLKKHFYRKVPQLPPNHCTAASPCSVWPTSQQKPQSVKTSTGLGPIDTMHNTGRAPRALCDCLNFPGPICLLVVAQPLCRRPFQRAPQAICMKWVMSEAIQHWIPCTPAISYRIACSDDIAQHSTPAQPYMCYIYILYMWCYIIYIHIFRLLIMGSDSITVCVELTVPHLSWPFTPDVTFLYVPWICQASSSRWPHVVGDWAGPCYLDKTDQSAWTGRLWNLESEPTKRICCASLTNGSNLLTFERCKQNAAAAFGTHGPWP